LFYLVVSQFINFYGTCDITVYCGHLYLTEQNFTCKSSLCKYTYNHPIKYKLKLKQI